MCRVVGKSIKIEKLKKVSAAVPSLSVTGRQSSVIRRSASSQRLRGGQARPGARAEAADAEAGHEDAEEVYAEHGDSAALLAAAAHIPTKFETEPSKYFEDKIFSALFDNLLIRNSILRNEHFPNCIASEKIILCEIMNLGIGFLRVASSVCPPASSPPSPATRTR